MGNARQDEAETGIKTARRNINNLRHPDNATLMAESKEELKNILMKEKQESEKAELKLNLQKNEDHGIRSHHFMANRWEKMETVRLYFVGAPKSLQMVNSAMKLKDVYSLEQNS